MTAMLAQDDLRYVIMGFSLFSLALDFSVYEIYLKIDCMGFNV